MPSQVKEIRKEELDLEVDGKLETLPNDFVIVCIGGELPTEFLGSLGIGMRRHYATKPGQEVEKDALLIAMEAMKVQMYINSPIKGVVKEVLVAPGTRIDTGDLLVVFQ